ncbi:hypothetical protein N657DRAFT_613035 [Parathielavia appendiculata]|uniref:Uncharacterized protein n=1 Tax=Parathielavia appendiculata TaxID=2587402 RepID=A0AAN6U8E9_9PEZI|nr:hypothetical protein N657DRAFT_613035 [Parathielavia appendiculata]
MSKACLADFVLGLKGLCIFSFFSEAAPFFCPWQQPLYCFQLLDPTSMSLLFALSFVHALPHVHPSHVLLSSRQADGVVDTSTFLRRAYHSSVVLNRRVYIDGGEVSYKKGEDITYQYCMDCHSELIGSRRLTHSQQTHCCR